jgi:hypothetical protein
MKIRLLVIVVTFMLLLVSCSQADLLLENTKDRSGLPETQTHPTVVADSLPDSGYPIVTETEEPLPGYPIATEPTGLSLLVAADVVVEALSQMDLETVAEFVHPEKGLRFSPYTYVEDDHQVFMPAELPGLVGSDQVYLWGFYDGTGDPIELTFDAYYEQFVYSADFANPEEMAIDEELGWGNTINNITEFYPGSSFVEYHFSGFEEQYQGMDWESLRLVFIQEEGTWYLIGIVHNQWTI